MKMKRRPVLVVVGCVSLLLLFSQAAYTEVRVPSVIGSGMVLQRDQPVPIWGWADAGEEVTLVLRDADQTIEHVQTRADQDGNWRVELGPRPAGGPYSLTINELDLTDLLYGEVWLCSGQSNMEWPVMGGGRSGNGDSGGYLPEDPTVPRPEGAGRFTHAGRLGSLAVRLPETIATFSAVCYYFGREIHSDLNVPVGLIASAWGGTKIEPWTPPAGFRSVDGLGPMADYALATDASYREQLPATLESLEAWVNSTRAALESGGPILPMPAISHPLAQETQPTALYNGMIHPLAPFAIRGATWYQGEANVGEGMSYRDKMHALINGWREVWDQGDFSVLLRPARSVRLHLA